MKMSSVDCLPYYVQGKVVSGFGRGSKELGIPTANFPSEVVQLLPESLKCGVYYGWASVDGVCGVHKMVLSVGWNVFYGNDIKTMETHILKKFDQDFYGENLRVVILGFIRPMCNFDSLDVLITAIQNDIRVADEQLSKSENLVYQQDPHFNLPNPVAKSNQTDSSANGTNPASSTDLTHSNGNTKSSSDKDIISKGDHVVLTKTMAKIPNKTNGNAPETCLESDNGAENDIPRPNSEDGCSVISEHGGLSPEDVQDLR